MKKVSPEEVLNKRRMSMLDDWLRNGKRVNRLFGLKELIDKYLNKDTIMCEIGSFEGASSELFALTCKEVHCVDGLFQPAFTLVEERRDNIIKIKKWSKDAAKMYEDGFFDFIYIDADHRYEEVIKDIRNWKSKVKVGGYLGGHDYIDTWGLAGVIKAVDEMFNKDEIETFEDSSWIIKIKK